MAEKVQDQEGWWCLHLQWEEHNAGWNWSKSKWLPNNWFVQVKKQQNVAQGKWTWFNFQLHACVAIENFLGLPSYLADDDMQMHLEEQMSEDLGKVYLHANHAKEMENITDFDKWVEEVHMLNENLCNEVLHGKKLFQALLAQSSSSSATSSTSKSSCPPCGITDTTTTVKKTAEASTGSGLLKGSKTRPPHLTKSERELLMKHLGCFVCCQFYTDHIGIDCKEGSLDPATYCTLTEADGITAKKAYKDRKKTIIAGLTLHTTLLSALSDNEDMIGDSSDSALTDNIDFD